MVTDAKNDTLKGSSLDEEERGVEMGYMHLLVKNSLD